MGSEDFWRSRGLLADLQIICTIAVIADYFCHCRFLDLVLFLRKNVQDFWRVSEFLGRVPE